MSDDKVNAANESVSVQASQHSEQAIVELIYVQEANNLLGTALNNLDSALNTTQSVLNILQAIQNLANDITVQTPSAIPFNYATGSVLVPITTSIGLQFTGVGAAQRMTMEQRVTYGYGMTMKNGQQVGTYHGLVTISSATDGSQNSTITQYQAIYNRVASAYFGQAISPTFVFSSINAPGYSTFSSELKALKDKLRLEISVLTKQTPASAQNDPTSLLATVRKVYGDMPSNFQFSTVEKWALDNYNQGSAAGTAATKAGSMENDLTYAITAAQSLNDTQKENVRQFLFIFQEYYQSAAAVLSTITQSIQAIAQHIADQ